MQHSGTDGSSHREFDDKIAAAKTQIALFPLKASLWAKLGFVCQLRDTHHHDSGMNQKEALFAYKMALKLLDPCSHLFLIVWFRMGLLLKTMGNYQEAISAQLFLAARLYFPLDRATSLHYAADSLAAMNQPQQALEKYHLALSACPRHLVSYLGIVDCMAELRTPENDWCALLQEMYCCIGREAIASPISRASSVSSASVLSGYSPPRPTPFNLPSAFFFAMFRTAHFLKEHYQAWQLLERANTVQKIERSVTDLSDKLAALRANTTTIKNVFTSGFWPQGVGHNSATPVFIVGMMRSGSTLLEHMLDAHSGVVGIGEDSALNHYLPSLLQQIQGCVHNHPPSPSRHSESASQSSYAKINKLIREIGDKVVTRMTGKALDAMAANEKLPGSPKSTKRPVRIIDKMLFNYRNIGLIHMVFPNAIILHTVRDPMDTIFGCFKQKFDDSGLDWAMDLTGLCAQYTAYLEIMSHWEKLLPGRVQHVVYEELALDPENELRRVLKVLGLPWEKEVLQAHSRPRAVHTHSMGQVRHAVSGSAIGGWMKYEQMLLPTVRPLLETAFKRSSITELFPSLNWGMDVNFVQRKSQRDSETETSPVDDEAGLSLCSDTAQLSQQQQLPQPQPLPRITKGPGSNPLGGKLPAPSEDPFASYARVVDRSLHCDKSLQLESVVADISDMLCFDSPGFHHLSSIDIEQIQAQQSGDKPPRNLVHTPSFVVSADSADDVALYCLLLGLARRHVHWSAGVLASSSLMACNGVYHISLCVNQHLHAPKT